MYAIFDRKMKEFGMLVLSRNDESIRRSLVDGIRGSKSVQELHPEDFDLVCVGEFDQDVGELTGSSPRLVVSVAEILEAYAER